MSEFENLYCSDCKVDQSHVDTGMSKRCVICQMERDILCSCCAGMGCIDVGDCEDGVMETCPQCQGTGKEDYQ